MMKHIGEWARLAPLRTLVVNLAKRHAADFKIKLNTALEDIRFVSDRLLGEVDLDRDQDEGDHS